jgi:hypothetical protein
MSRLFTPSRDHIQPYLRGLCKKALGSWWLLPLSNRGQQLSTPVPEESHLVTDCRSLQPPTVIHWQGHVTPQRWPQIDPWLFRTRPQFQKNLVHWPASSLHCSITYLGRLLFPLKRRVRFLPPMYPHQGPDGFDYFSITAEDLEHGPFKVGRWSLPQGVEGNDTPAALCLATGTAEHSPAPR